MPVIKIDEYKRNYTVVMNDIFKDKTLSLKAKGLLCFAMSVSKNWDFSKRGLSKTCKDKEASIETALRELEEHFYLTREMGRQQGKFSPIYTFYETPYLNPAIAEKTARLKTRGRQVVQLKRS